MRASIVVSFILTVFSSFVAAAQPERTVDIFAWPLSEPKSHTLAKISYTSSNATVKSYNPPKVSSGDDVVRIGFHHSGSWSGVATAASNFAPDKEQKLLLHLDTAGELYHVGFMASDLPSSSKTGKGKNGLVAEVVKMQKGPAPQLNKPVVLTPDGAMPEKEPEKTWLQKYWWILVGFLVLQLVVGGGGKE